MKSQGSSANLNKAIWGIFKLLRCLHWDSLASIVWDNLSKLTVDNLQFADSHLAISLVQRKNDQFREGSWVFMACSDSSPCPVAVVEKFLKVGSHDRKSRLFRRILHTRKRMELRKEPMSYSRASELVKQERLREGLEPSLYGIHCLRVGGASAAAACGMAQREV